MKSFVSAIACFVASASWAQGPSPKANPADVKSVDSIIHALYDVISNAPGAKPDWDRFRSLFFVDAHLIVAGSRGNAASIRSLTPEDYIRISGPAIEQNGFSEKELARKTDKFAHMAQVFSTFESRIKNDDPKPFERGINAIQLFNDGARWWIVSVYWESENSKNPLPKEYLPIGGKGG